MQTKGLGWWDTTDAHIPDLHVHRLVYFGCDTACDIIVIFCQLTWVRSVLWPVLETNIGHILRMTWTKKEKEMRH